MPSAPAFKARLPAGEILFVFGVRVHKRNAGARGQRIHRHLAARKSQRVMQFLTGCITRVQQCKVFVCHFDGLPNCSSANKVTADNVVKDNLVFRKSYPTSGP